MSFGIYSRDEIISALLNLQQRVVFTLSTDLQQITPDTQIYFPGNESYTCPLSGFTGLFGEGSTKFANYNWIISELETN